MKLMHYHSKDWGIDWYYFTVSRTIFFLFIMQKYEIIRSEKDVVLPFYCFIMVNLTVI